MRDRAPTPRPVDLDRGPRPSPDAIVPVTARTSPLTSDRQRGLSRAAVACAMTRATVADIRGVASTERTPAGPSRARAVASVILERSRGAAPPG